MVIEEVILSWIVAVSANSRPISSRTDWSVARARAPLVGSSQFWFVWLSTSGKLSAKVTSARSFGTRRVAPRTMARPNRNIANLVTTSAYAVKGETLAGGTDTGLGT